MADSTSNPIAFFLGDALATVGSDAAYYYGNRLTQDSADDDLQLYALQQAGYAVDAQKSLALRTGSIAPTVTAGASATLTPQMLLIGAVLIGLFMLARK